MKRVLSNWAIGLTVVGIAMGAGRVEAQVPGAPAYLHAIYDMRLARAYLKSDTRPEFEPQKHHAVLELIEAINEIKSASIDDGKDPDFVPPTNPQGLAAGPFHEALRLLRKAHDECNSGVDLPNASDMKQRALSHIDEAARTIDRMIRESSAF